MSTSSAHDYQLEFLSNISLENSRFTPSQSPIVLLCGGRVANTLPLSSFRHALTNYLPLPRYELFCPEEITDWKEDGVFYDLLDLEKELGSICSLVVIVLESEGAFAELGAFSQMPHLRTKIFAINSEEFHEESSFINLGVLRHLRKEERVEVRVYPWEIRNPGVLENDVVKDALDDIEEQLRKVRTTHAFSKDNDGHVITLICELVRIFVALKEGEILDFLDLLGIEVSRESLRRKLFVLDKFRVVVKGRYSDSTFYLRDGTDFNKIRFVQQDGAAYDDLRVLLRCKELYQEDRKHRNRMRVIKAQEQKNG
ncbi:retron St85 family effector protein [Halomonas halmophila]|uniref:Uncharacterized protein n=1 Tax=Halomonas halmophila TaxID=252 RepID=A0A4Y4F2T7_9GAMM|nr:retron St85 family effector protein [Halomonas halmophila]GED23613.1 hypothetical protein HHA01_25900 [Halomonas halmophila]